MKLTLEAFRGANRPFSISFDHRSHLSIIYGENGSGKTTISDAFEFLFRGTAGSLHEKSLDGKQKIPALIHAQRKKSDLSVTWEHGNQTTTAKIGTTKAEITGDDPGRLHTLSRKNITNLIEETPSNRFKRIQEFVSIPALEEEEAQLTSFIAEQKKQQEQLVKNAEQAEHFRHVIITSHYQPLRFKFRWGILTQAKADFIELGPWTLEHGMTLSKGTTSEIASLRKDLAEGEDATTIAAKSGIVLERLLDFLTGIYQCRLPRNPGAEQRWTLDHYKTGLRSERKLLPALRCDHLADDGSVTSHEIAPLLDDIFDKLQFRNAIGCHYKELTSHFNEIGEAVKLGQATLALVEALCDPNDELPESRKDGTSWHNKGPITRRLHPVVIPR